jgi:hypothetical protein
MSRPEPKLSWPELGLSKGGAGHVSMRIGKCEHSGGITTNSVEIVVTSLILFCQLVLSMNVSNLVDLLQRIRTKNPKVN